VLGAAKGTRSVDQGPQKAAEENGHERYGPPERVQGGYGYVCDDGADGSCDNDENGEASCPLWCAAAMYEPPANKNTGRNGEEQTESRPDRFEPVSRGCGCGEK
jgi:hypothetical protein